MRKEKVAPSDSAHSEAGLIGDLCVGICGWTYGRDAFSYIDDDTKVYASPDAQRIARLPV